VESFVATAPVAGDDRQSLALDVGCGNGRHAELLAGVADRVVGVDASLEMLGEARRRAADGGFDLDAVQADAGTLPVRDGRVDLAVYVAAIHHLHPRARRVASLDELARVLAPGGRALVSAWSTTHGRFADVEAGEDGFDTTVDWTLPDGERVPRYYHIYAPTEFGADLDASRLAVHETFTEEGNCYGVVGPGVGTG
jgi:ubiquinone/menaquinone biosynthesis C-methylase UbiE